MPVKILNSCVCFAVVCIFVFEVGGRCGFASSACVGRTWTRVLRVKDCSQEVALGPREAWDLVWLFGASVLWQLMTNLPLLQSSNPCVKCHQCVIVACACDEKLSRLSTPLISPLGGEVKRVDMILLTSHTTCMMEVAGTDHNTVLQDLSYSSTCWYKLV